MHSFVDPNKFTWLLFAAPLVVIYLFFVRHRALAFLEVVGMVAALALALTAYGVVTLRTYGWMLFVAVPFVAGLASVLLYKWKAPARPFTAYLAVASCALTLVGIGLLLFALEGVLCLIMAAPLALGLAALGVLLGYSLHWQEHAEAAALLLLVLGTPFLMGAEAAAPRQAPLYAVTTSMVVDAPPEVIWKYVVSLPDPGPPTEWIFRAGVAYPVRTELDGAGAGAARRCILSTGAMPETIEVWEEPRLLRFAIHKTPPSLRELSPWGTIHPAHLEGFYTSRRGEFRLVPLAGGRTRVIGTSWYQHGLYPAGYWRLWSDWVIHQVHRRVLGSIKRLAEAERASVRGDARMGRPAAVAL